MATQSAVSTPSDYGDDDPVSLAVDPSFFNSPSLPGADPSGLSPTFLPPGPRLPQFQYDAPPIRAEILSQTQGSLPSSSWNNNLLTNIFSSSPAGAASLPAQKQNVPTTVNAAVGGQGGGDRVVVKTPQAAAAVAKAWSPSLSPAATNQAAQQIFSDAKQGRPIYKPGRRDGASYLPWIIGAVVVIGIIGTVMVVSANKD